jgi:hypothetical protein
MNDFALLQVGLPLCFGIEKIVRQMSPIPTLAFECFQICGVDSVASKFVFG